jgi:hypothetical protein
MPLAVIADIHGKLPALEAVLADIERQSIQTLLVAGDLVGGCPFPNEVIARLRPLTSHIICEPIRILHGSPCGVSDGIFPAKDPAKLERALGAIEEQVMVCAHTHMPWVGAAVASWRSIREG